MQLAKGQNIPLGATVVRLTVRGDSGGPPLYVALLGSDDRTRSPADLVHHGAEAHPSGAVSLAGDQVVADTGLVESDVQRVVVLAASAGGSPLPHLDLAVTDGNGGGLAGFGIPPGGDTALIVCEVYRRAGQWKIRAVGQGYRDGLYFAARDFGFAVPSGSTAASVAAPAPPVSVPRPRRDRGNRGLVASASASAPASPPVVARPVAPPPVTPPPVAPPPPTAVPRPSRSPGAPRRPEPAGVPVLARRTDLLDLIDRQRRTIAASVVSLAARCVADGAASMPSTRAAEQRIAGELTERREAIWHAYEDTRNALIQRYSGVFSEGLPATWRARQVESRASYISTSSRDAAAWMQAAGTVANSVHTAGLRMTSAGRAQQRRELTAAVERVLNGYDGAVRDAELAAEGKITRLFTDTFADFRRRMSDALPRTVGNYAYTELDLIEPAPAEAGPVWQAVASVEDIAPSPPTRLVFPVGELCLSEARLDTRLAVPDPPGGEHTHRFALPLAESTPPVPALLDLDETGGIVTNSTAVVQNLTLDMLAALPAGRLKIDVVDPAKVGASMNFLYGLGEAGEKIYGQKVWGSHNVAELLTELENHVAFVTQKYLQGTHDSLTAYNRAAGEVAEPYRLLLLFDHPHAFTRDGRTFDDESLKRLERLATVGRRAGVLIAATTDSTNRSLEALATAYTGFEDGALVDYLGLPRAVSGGDFVPSCMLEWQLAPHPVPDDATRTEVLAHIERTLGQSSGTQVDPARVHELASRAAARAVAKGTQAPAVIADPHEPGSWWQADVDERIVARFGRMGASDVAELRLDSGGASSALVGGRTGSGKSVLLHSIVLGLAMQYSPADLEFYLVDFKEGVEFKPYAEHQLPHARVVAIETNRDFGISVLESLDAEISRRGVLFKSGQQQMQDIGRYRQATGERLPRIVLVMDEFHMLLEQDDAIATRGAELIDRIIRQGRAFGVHTILASQSVSGGGQKIRTALNQIPNRLVLASSNQDSEQLLAEGNADAQLLSKPGEGIINTSGGLKDANNRFQCAFWPPELRTRLVEQMRKQADAQQVGHRPVVFEGDVAIVPSEHDPAIFTGSSRNGTLLLPIGAPMSLAPPLSIRLERQPGNNLLIVDPSALTALALHMLALRAADVQVEYVDFAAIDPSQEDLFGRLRAAGAQAYHRRKLGDVLDSLVAEIAERTELDDYTARARVLFLVGVHRARELTPDTYDAETESGRLAEVLRQGPEVGVHVVAWGDRYASLQRRFDHDGFRQFGFKVLGPCSEDDSRTLIDSEVAAKLTTNQFAVDDYDNARTDLVRRFAAPDTEWVDGLLSGTSDG